MDLHLGRVDLEVSRGGMKVVSSSVEEADGLQHCPASEVTWIEDAESLVPLVETVSLQGLKWPCG